VVFLVPLQVFDVNCWSVTQDFEVKSEPEK
jgi:hypothetical protein